MPGRRRARRSLPARAHRTRAARTQSDAAEIEAVFEAKMQALRVAFGYDVPTADIGELLRSLDDDVPGAPAS
jgi:5-formyltetrahydrofolate cyclo-ligase